MALEDDAHLDVCQNIEAGLKEQYELHPDLTDKLCVFVGEERIGKVNDLTLKKYLNRVDKIKRSVNRHATEGPRAYYEVIRNFI